ncbi:hypothetical protein IFR05_013677 [Cadophora sp. M221]|nr:hypothetical protein IFR05_013677 [Cadophora sp. M221]
MVVDIERVSRMPVANKQLGNVLGGYQRDDLVVVPDTETVIPGRSIDAGIAWRFSSTQFSDWAWKSQLDDDLGLRPSDFRLTIRLQCEVLSLEWAGIVGIVIRDSNIMKLQHFEYHKKELVAQLESVANGLHIAFLELSPAMMSVGLMWKGVKCEPVLEERVAEMWKGVTSREAQVCVLQGILQPNEK